MFRSFALRLRFLILIWSAGAVAQSKDALNGMAATGHPLATDAAIEAMQAGGTAVDGAIAAALTLAVVDGHNSGLGGGAFWLIHAPDGSITAIDGRETAPAASTRDMFLRTGRADPELSQTGPLAAAVPGWVAALEDASRSGAKLPVARAYGRAATLAAEGFVPDAAYESRLHATNADLRRFPATAEAFLSPRDENGRLRQPDLATTLRALAEHGSDWFYRGPFAQLTASWMAENGGRLTAADFSSYRSVRRDPLRTQYRGHDIIGFPPPSSGGVHVAQILNILEIFDLPSFGDRSTDFAHTVAGAMTLAFADRAHWLGDPDFAAVPRGLIEKDYAAMLAAKLNPQRAAIVPGHSRPPDAAGAVFRKHTTHLSVADRHGWWVACTATINTSFGSKVVVPGTGVVLNNEMDDFSALPGAPNAFGLVGAEANAIAPHKRPLSSMSPTLVLRDGKPIASLGAAGGPTIITQVALALVRTLDFEQPPAEALAGPRLHHQWRPDSLRLENAFPRPVREALSARGHSLDLTPSFGAAQMIAQTPDGRFLGAADPRGLGRARGW
ncbi:MAG: gamma-glutamyltransferase [Verrucomicrobiales bacterium]